MAVAEFWRSHVLTRGRLLAAGLVSMIAKRDAMCMTMSQIANESRLARPPLSSDYVDLDRWSIVNIVS